MKAFRVLMIVLAMAVPVAAQNPVSRLPSADPDTISVTGMARVSLVPDRFSFNVGVQTTAPTVEEAVNQNNARIVAVIAALKKSGATSEEIQTSNFNIYPQQEYEQVVSSDGISCLEAGAASGPRSSSCTGSAALEWFSRDVPREP